jgi:type I restriction enzyme, S subunit
MWKTVKLGEICDFQNGFAFKSALFREKGKPILRISNIQNQEVDTRKPVYFNENDYDIDFTRYEVKPNDLVIAMSGATTGKIGFNKTSTTFYLNQRVGNLKPKAALNKYFLYYLLSTKVEENLNISKGAAQPNLSSEQIKNIEFSLPPLAEQQRIVAKLDAAFAEIDKALELTKQRESALTALKSSILSDELGE